MKKEEDDIELRSEEFQEVLGSVPSWILRWGITVVALIIIVLLIGSAVFKYPDTISAAITLTGTSPAASIMSKTSGKIDEFYVSNNKLVSKGDYLAVIENPAKTEDILYLREYLNVLSIKTDSVSALPPKDINVGNLQGLYSSLYITLSEYKQFKSLDYYLKKMEFAKEKVNQTHVTYGNLLRQRAIMEEQLAIIKKQHFRDSLLNKKGMLSDENAENTRNQYLQSCLSLESMNTTLENLLLQNLQTEESLLDIQYQYQERKNNLEVQLKSYINQLMMEIEAWEMTYVLQAPIDGFITFNKFWIENQNIIAGEKVFDIIPVSSGRLMGKAILPLERSGKVEVGQKVNIRFSNFPDNEFGIVRGRVENISLVPSKGSEENSYVIDISLPDGLKTTYKKELPYLPEMEGVAEIITKDISLLERFLMPIRKVLTENI